MANRFQENHVVTEDGIQSDGLAVTCLVAPISQAEEVQVNSDQLFDNLKIEHSRYVTSDGLAKALNVSVNTIRKWRSQRKIAPYVFGRSVRYVVDEVVAALTQKGKRYEKQRR